MSLWRYPRTAAALCIAAVLACAAAPAAFLAASDAAYFGRVETVADPYRAPTPTADDYYILRQLAARGQDTTARQTTPQQEQDAAPQTPKVYIGASASIESMTWADTAATTAAARRKSRSSRSKGTSQLRKTEETAAGRERTGGIGRDKYERDDLGP